MYANNADGVAYVLNADGVAYAFNAEGVAFHSPGSTRSGAPWVTVETELPPAL
jgi:hypothetical protein